MSSFFRFSLKTQFSLLIAGLMGVAIVAAAIIGQSIMVTQTLNQGRAIADMVEYIGKWGSQYGGIHVKSVGHTGVQTGSFLERRAYAANDGDQALLSSKRAPIADELAAMSRMDAYYWKNPALIQREISDISAKSTSGAKFRITARSVLNPNNSPTPFELEALDNITRQLDTGGASSGRRAEYTRVDGGRLLYARAMMANDSCLRCHGDRNSAPRFLLANSEFNGGGGFGYQPGKAAGIISVTVPLPQTFEAMASNLSLEGWVALLAIAAASVLMLVFVMTRVISPINRLRTLADTLASMRLGKDFTVAPLGADLNNPRSDNEVHRLAGAITRLGHSLKFLHGRQSQNPQSKP